MRATTHNQGFAQLQIFCSLGRFENPPFSSNWLQSARNPSISFNFDTPEMGFGGQWTTGRYNLHTWTTNFIWRATQKDLTAVPSFSRCLASGWVFKIREPNSQGTNFDGTFGRGKNLTTTKTILIDLCYRWKKSLIKFDTTRGKVFRVSAFAWLVLL